MNPVRTVATKPQRRRDKRRVYAACLLIVVTIVCLSGCSADKHEPGHKSSGELTIVKGIATETISSSPIPETIDIVGTVRARTSAVVSTRIPGTISVLRLREGDRVTKGQLLIQLEARENQANAAVAVAGMDEAQRSLDEALSRKGLAETTFERYQRLYSEQAVTPQEFDVKRNERDLAAQGAERARAKLRQARESAQAAETMADYTKIVAPISGIITFRQADLGATVFPGQPLMTIEDQGNYLLELALPENMSSTVKPGTPLQVTLDALGSSFPAKIAELVPSADPGSRTFTAKVNLELKGLKSGMFGHGSISTGNSVSGMLAPHKAIVVRGALTSVWTVDKENIAHMRLIKVGKKSGDKVEILSGLSDGERVVVSGVEKVTEGAKVE